jgi:hypothetical protein
MTDRYSSRKPSRCRNKWDSSYPGVIGVHLFKASCNSSPTDDRIPGPCPGAHRPPAKAHTRGGQYEFELLSRRLRRTQSAELERRKDVTVEARLLNTAQGANSSSSENVRTLLGFFCKIFSFAKFPFGLKPELHIPSHRFVVFFPDFPGALPNFLFVGLSQSAGFAVSVLPPGPRYPARFPDRQPTARNYGTCWPSLRGWRRDAFDSPCSPLELDDGAAKMFTPSLSQS